MTRKKGKKRVRPPEKEFLNMYYNRVDLTIHDIAEHYNVKPQTIYNWAYQFRKENEHD